MRFLSLLLILTGGAAFAGESVVLANGARWHVERHEVVDSKIRLYQGEGYVEMDSARVQGFEADDPAPAVPPAVAPVSEQPIATAPSPQELADAAADKYGLPRKLVRSVMGAESGFSPQA